MTDPAETPTTEPLSPWERLPEGEGPEAWEAFQNYRDAGPERSVRRTAASLGKSGTLIGQWSSRHAWVARVEAWDDELDRLRRAEHVEAVRSMATRHVGIAHKMLEKVVQRLETLDVDSLTPHQLARFARDAVTIERLALGQPTANDPANGEQDEAVIASITEAAARYFEDREALAFMEGAAAGAAVAAYEVVPENA